jgi:hypothetical protein
MLKASQKRLEQQNKNLKKQVQYLQELSQSKVDFQNVLIEEQEKNKLLQNELFMAKNTIEKQKKEYKKIEIPNCKFESEINNHSPQNHYYKEV